MTSEARSSRGGDGGRAEFSRGCATALRAAVEDAARAAERLGRPQWVALRAAQPRRCGLAAFALWSDAERFFWERPSEEISIAASGALHAIETSGPRRFEKAAERARNLFRELRVVGDNAPESAGPLLVGGFSFADRASTSPHWRDFPPARLVLPEVLLTRRGERAWCTISRAVAPGADVESECRALRARLDGLDSERERANRNSGARASMPPQLTTAAPEYHAVADRSHAEYRALVAAALRDIATADLEKVVVARSALLARDEGFDPTSLLDTLRCSYPSCASFAVARPGGVFLGAMPERLVRLQGRRVTCAVLAGSAPRGRSPEEDEGLGRRLRESKKEQAEHASVVRAVRAVLAERCSTLDAPEAPRLLRLEGIQHLETPIAATLCNDASVVELAGELHPTPAVAGSPRDAALSWLARAEQLDRGWYAGPVGFVNRSGGGEFCVALRSALLSEGKARLFAGAGIVAGSDPESELRETRLKLRALLAPLLEI
jgi:isochorismate synthase